MDTSDIRIELQRVPDEIDYWDPFQSGFKTETAIITLCAIQTALLAGTNCIGLQQVSQLLQQIEQALSVEGHVLSSPVGSKP